MSEPAEAVKGRLILAVDDDEHTRNLLRDLCEAAGYRVSLAEDGEAALEQMAQERPDLVLLDLMMPRKDGFAVLQAVRQSAELKDTPVVILTAMGDMDGKIRGMELGADDYVTKPFKLVELQTRISSALMVRDYRKRLAAAEEELSQLRAVDPVTGAGTYSQLKASLDAELARSRRYGRPAAALMFGVDDYQSLRYQLGREKCDELIAQIASEIRSSLRGADRLFRIDTDEFVVLLPETDLKGSHLTAQRLGAIVRQFAPEGRSGKVSVKVRIGGAVFPHERVSSSEDLLREANRSYRALREAGPDKLVFDA
ncbi:MAG: response regulator [Myxococcales bacterium]|nr:response regulator [Myxococcales bacterium]